MKVLQKPTEKWLPVQYVCTAEWETTQHQGTLMAALSNVPIVYGCVEVIWSSKWLLHTEWFYFKIAH